MALNTVVRRVIIDSSNNETAPRAVGVEVEKDGVVRKVYAEKEVILSAGAIRYIHSFSAVLLLAERDPIMDAVSLQLSPFAHAFWSRT